MVNARRRNELQALSKVAFGHDHRLTLARELLHRTDDLATVDSIAAATGIPVSTLHRELRDLEELGAAERVDDREGARYRRVDSPFWEWCRDLLGTVAAHS